jgi:7,8-dihydroneopterin aldolase/epimerase/oxygenase
MNGRIQLKNMTFYVYHGNLAEENALGQRFVIDLVLSVDMTDAARTDRLEHTVDYVQVFSLCREVVEHERVKLLETLANRILDRLLAAFPRVRSIDIVIKKPSAPMPGVLDYVAIETSKGRD